MDTLDRRAAVEDLRRVMAGYVQHADHHRWRELAELFVQDGSFTPLKVDGSELVRVEGREQIAALNAKRHPWQPSHDRTPQVEAPAGFTFLLGAAFPPGAHTPEERIAAFKAGPMGPWYNPVNIRAHRKGGHFGPWENPEAFITDIRATFRRLR